MKRKILIVEDNISLSQMQKDWFAQAGYDAVTAMNEPVARSLIRKITFDLILSDVRLPEGDGISLLEWLRKEKRDIPFIITTEYVSVSDVVRTIKLGAIDYLPKPVHREHLLELAEDVFRPMVTVRKKEKVLFHRTSPKIEQVEKYARLVAPSEMAVMILGANGTGKESVAQSIHQGSERWNKPFVAVNCGALPRELAASLLFGHEKGAFTGADTAKAGYFDMAKGGTLFLDEIGTMSFEIQSMLLRVLQESTYTPIGSSKERIADVRIVSATNEDLQQAIKEGRFREDLYHRLNEFEIQQPSLAECPEDILPLAEFFRERYSKELKRETSGFSDDARSKMLAYPWPGNVRELKNITEQISIIETNREITAEILRGYLPVQPVSKFPTLLGGVKPQGEKSFQSEREILYQVLFDLRRDVTELKKLVHDIMAERAAGGTVTAPSSMPVHYIPETPSSLIQPSAVVLNPAEEVGKVSSVTPVTNVSQVNPNVKVTHADVSDDVQDTEEYIEENLSLDEVEKEMIRKALERHHGKRKNAANDLKISERTLYRKIKEYGLE